MALITKTERNIGLTPATIGSYVVPSSTDSTIIGLFVSNIAGTGVKASVMVNDGTNDIYIVKAVDLAISGSTAVINTSSGKLTLKTGWSIKVVSDTATSLDVIMTCVETVA